MALPVFVDVACCQRNEQVKIDTVHRAKGLDLTAVYILTLSSRRMPGETVERETLRRRQRFVGQTRARDRHWVGTVVERRPGPR